jgi:uncharacterized protein HemX
MAGEGAFLLVVFLVVGVGGGLLLYALVQREHDQRETTDWENGERAARRDSDERRR